MVITLLILNRNKFVILLKGVSSVLIISMILAYFRSIIPIETQNNASNINAGINSYSLRAILPLLLSPIVEEWIFRKWLPNTFQDVIGRKRAVILSNVLFSLFHLDIYFIPYLANGLIYSWFYERTKDLRIPIIMHILYNIIVFLTTNLIL